MKLTAELGGLRTVRGNIRKLINDHPEMAAKALRTSALAILVPAIQARIRQNSSVFTGEYHSRMNARTEVVNRATKVALEVGAFGVPYGLNIEKGAPAHSPNRRRIEEYVRKKSGLSGSAAEALVNAIMASIQAVGSKAHPAIIPAWQANSSRFFADFVRRMKAAIAMSLPAGAGGP